MIRQAIAADLEAIVRIVHEAQSHMEFVKHDSGGFKTFDLETAVNIAFEAMQSPNAHLLVAEMDNEVVGACCVVLSPFLWNRNVISATEIFWHMTPRVYPSMTGKKLFVGMLNRMVEWSKSRGALWFQSITPPGVTARMLEKRGFQLVENSYGGMI